MSYSGDSHYSNPRYVTTPISDSAIDEMRRQIQDEMNSFKEDFNNTISMILIYMKELTNNFM